MNKQGPNGIEYCDYTVNPIGGCGHRCRWRMPDGKIAICYAEATAEGIASRAYPHGFQHHYWHPDRLQEPLKVKQPSRIFVGSMSDLFGTYVPAWQIQEVFAMMRKAHWHTFLSLTKNAPRLLKFKDELPPNLWVGVSLPPTFMHGRELKPFQQDRMLIRSLDVLAQLPPVRWISFEPLSFDVVMAINEANIYRLPIDWAVIGAASNGRMTYQPQEYWVESLLDLLDYQECPVFFKGNLKWSTCREEFPLQLRLF